MGRRLTSARNVQNFTKEFVKEDNNGRIGWILEGIRRTSALVLACLCTIGFSLYCPTGSETIEISEYDQEVFCKNLSPTNEFKNNVVTLKTDNEVLASKTYNEQLNIENPDKTEIKTTESLSVSPSVSSNSTQETNDELMLLARLVYAEAGCSWLSDYHQMAVASVVLNRVHHELFPNSITEVIYQTGQYSPVSSGKINNNPDERTILNVKYVLENGSILPSDVIWQSGCPQGNGVYDAVYDSTLGTTTYFCY